MNNKRRKEYDKAYMRMALSIEKLSYAKRNQVGCVIVSSNDQVISQGFNGMPKGMDNCCEYEERIDDKRCLYCGQEHCEGCQNIKLVTKPEVLHAESNAIVKCAKQGNPTEGSTLYVTLSPCFDCAKLIIQAGIVKVVYLREYRDTSGIDLLRINNVIVEQLVLDE